MYSSILLLSAICFTEIFLTFFSTSYLFIYFFSHDIKLIQRERKRWEFSESKYFSLKVALKYTTNSGVSQSKDVTGSKVGIIVSKLHLLDNQKVAGEPDFDGGTGELKLLTKTSKGIQGP